MGFLNNTTVTVDAILTKKGRELLAQGTDAFNITKFALADDEVDYNLWDVTHPNGSDYYGNVIENMPLLEASPDETQVMKFKLLSLPKLTTNSLPNLLLNEDGAIEFTNANHENKLIQAKTENVTDNTYTATISDRTVVVFSGESAVQSDGSITRTFGKTETITLVAVLQNTAGATANLTVVGGDTGFSTTLSITNNYTDQN
tara:strand:- start:2305 stop:2910 length:606 start_codon:yes stop_codon:yes gene_type:complete